MIYLEGVHTTETGRSLFFFVLSWSLLVFIFVVVFDVANIFKDVHVVHFRQFFGKQNATDTVSV